MVPDPITALTEQLKTIFRRIVEAEHCAGSSSILFS